MSIVRDSEQVSIVVLGVSVRLLIICRIVAEPRRQNSFSFASLRRASGKDLKGGSSKS